MEYFVTKNVNVDEVLSSWRMTNSEIDNYIEESRRSLHKFMPSYESLNEIMDEDENKLRILLTLSDNYFVVIDNNKIVGVIAITNNKELTYVVPFKYHRSVHITKVIREIMNEYDLTKIVRIEDLGKNEVNDLGKNNVNYYDEEMNIIKRTIDILVTNGYKKEDILDDIKEYINVKTYQKK